MWNRITHKGLNWLSRNPYIFGPFGMVIHSMKSLGQWPFLWMSEQFPNSSCLPTCPSAFRILAGILSIPVAFPFFSSSYHHQCVLFKTNVVHSTCCRLIQNNSYSSLSFALLEFITLNSSLQKSLSSGHLVSHIPTILIFNLFIPIWCFLAYQLLAWF